MSTTLPAATLVLLVALTTPTTPAATARSGLITWLRDGRTLVVANPDSGTVTLARSRPLEVTGEFPVGGSPHAVAAAADGETLAVVLPDEDRLVWIDLTRRREVGAVETSGGPHAVVAHPLRNVVYVADSYSQTLSEIDVRASVITRRLSVEKAPRGLSLSADGSRLYVVHFHSGRLSVIDTGNFDLKAVIANRRDANLARCAAITPDGRTAFLPHVRSNVRSPHLQFDSTVFPVVSRVDLLEFRDLRRERIALEAIGRPVCNPWDAAVTPDGKRLIVANAGSDDLQVINIGSGRSLAQIDVGVNPRGIAVSGDGSRAYISNSLSGDLSEIDLHALREIGRVRVTQDPLPPEVRRGKVLFNSAHLRSMALDRWISCASCHPDGHSDGRVWLFPDGPRRTPQLHGAGSTLPHHLSPDRDEVQDAERFIRQVMGGTGLLPTRRPPPLLGPPAAGRSADADALAAYVRSLKPRVSPFASREGEHRTAVERGRAIFFDSKTRCRSCHPPPCYTDSSLDHRPWRLHDVGTGDGPGEHKGSAFDTPSLLGLYEATSFLHDGRARTLREVFTVHNRRDRHGVTSHLSAAELDDVVAFLLALPSEELPDDGD